MESVFKTAKHEQVADLQQQKFVEITNSSQKQDSQLFVSGQMTTERTVQNMLRTKLKSTAVMARSLLTAPDGTIVT